MALRGKLVRVVGVGLIGCVASLLGACGVSEKDYNAMKAENEDLRGRVATADGQLREKDGQIATLQDQVRQQAAAPKQQADWQPPARTTGGKGGNGGGRSSDVVIEVAGDVLFASGQATLKTEAKKELDGIVRTLNSKYSGHHVRIEGYTDSDQPKKGKYKTNEALSEARADAVRDYLVQKGISSNMISAVGMGSSKPKATKKDSRRVEIVVVGD